MKNSDLVLYSFLVESDYLTESEFKNLTEESKLETIKELTSSVLSTIKDKMSKIDTALIDKSKGEIRMYKYFDVIMNVLNNLEALVDKAAMQINPEITRQLKNIGKTILYLNQYSKQFKDAYRNKKTLLIMKYQSIILSIISATAYLMSSLVDFSDGNVTLNTSPKFEVIAPMRTLENFNNSIESGEFRIILRDVQAVRESFDENKVNGEVINEKEGILDFVSNLAGNVKNMLSNIDKDGKLVQLIYKAVGVVALVLSMRETFYSLGNMKTKLADTLENLGNFANLGSLTSGLVGKLDRFTKQFKSEAEFGTEMADREMSSEQRDISLAVSPSALKKMDSDDAPTDFSLFDF